MKDVSGDDAYTFVEVVDSSTNTSVSREEEMSGPSSYTMNLEVRK